MTQQLSDAAKELLADIASNPAVPPFSFVATGRVLDLRAAVEAAEKRPHTDFNSEFESWADSYSLKSEPNYSLATEEDCRAAYLAGFESGFVEGLDIQSNPDAPKYTVHPGGVGNPGFDDPVINITLSGFDDPRVQAVYEVLCDSEGPPTRHAEHWEGWVANRIVGRLASMGQKPVGLFLYDQVWGGYTQCGPFCEELGEASGLTEEQWKDELVPLYAAPGTQEASSYYVSVITTAYEQGFGKAWKGDTVKNPYAPGNGFDAWEIGYREGAMRRQQAGDNAPVAQQEAKPLSEAEVAALRSRYGWAKETIREIEAALGIGAKK